MEAMGLVFAYRKLKEWGGEVWDLLFTIKL